MGGGFGAVLGRVGIALGDGSVVVTACPLVRLSGQTWHAFRLRPREVDHAYEIALRFDWDAGTLSAFVDGQTLAAGAPFSRTMPLRYIAVYNWRSLARAAFSELMFSGACPYRLPAPPAPARRKRARCARPPTAVLAAVAVCLVAVALPLLLPSWQ